MRNNEIELIAALVEGTLEDETEARALVASSQKHKDEYEAHKIAYEALRSIPSAHLTEHETTALHRDVWTQLQSHPAAVATKVPWYYRWSYAAAGLLVVVGLVVVVDQSNPDFAPTALFGGDDAVESDTFAETATALDDDSISPSDGGATETTERSSDSGAAAEEADGASLYAAPNVARLAELATQTRIGELESFDLAANNFDKTIVDQMTQCITKAGLVDHEVVGDVEAENHYIVAVPTDAELGPETPISFVDINTCQQVHTED
jgi:hypothetical protein